MCACPQATTSFLGMTNSCQQAIAVSLAAHQISCRVQTAGVLTKCPCVHTLHTGSARSQKPDPGSASRQVSNACEITVFKWTACSQRLTGADTLMNLASKYFLAKIARCLSSSLHRSKSRWKKWQMTLSVLVTASRKSPAATHVCQQRHAKRADSCHAITRRTY